jgi:hypothetical protein
MTLLTNRGNVRTNLKIDPQKKIWSDNTLDRFINEGQRWILNDPAVEWPFGESVGFLVPVLTYQEYRESSDDNPENFFTTRLRKVTRAQVLSREMDFARYPEFSSGQGSSPSTLNLYAQRLFLNSGYDAAATYTTIHNMDTFDGNGTWTGSNDATTVATDASTFKEGSGSVSYSIDVSNSTSNKATLTNSTMSSIDLSGERLDEGGIILWAYLTDAGEIKSFEVKFGSDSSNYYAAKQYENDVQGVKYADGWNRIFIPTVNRQTVGSPDASAIDYVQLNIEFDSSETDQASCRIDNIQYVNKYIRYWFSRKSANLSTDSDESDIPSEYQFVYELYATYRALNTISGKEQQAQKFFADAKMNKNIMIEELLYNQPRDFSMPPRSSDGYYGQTSSPWQNS